LKFDFGVQKSREIYSAGPIAKPNCYRLNFFEPIRNRLSKDFFPRTPSKVSIDHSYLGSIKNRNRIGDRGDPCGIPVRVGIVSLSWPSNTILVLRPVRKDWVNLIIQSGRPFFLRIHRSLSCDTWSKAPLISRLSIDTTQPGRARHAAWTLEVIREMADSVGKQARNNIT